MPCPFSRRLHRVHHADPDFDVTTGVRFHPLEIIVSMLIKIASVLLLGPSVFAVVTFEIILNASSLFNHGNIALPEPLDKYLRRLIVTPDMHRVHHSVEDRETNSNFGFCLSVWDRLFGTYRAQPRAGHTDMKIGLQRFSNPSTTSTLNGMLLLPFTGGPGQSPLRHSRQRFAGLDAGRKNRLYRSRYGFLNSSVNRSELPFTVLRPTS